MIHHDPTAMAQHALRRAHYALQKHDNHQIRHLLHLTLKAEENTRAAMHHQNFALAWQWAHVAESHAHAAEFHAHVHHHVMHHPIIQHYMHQLHQWHASQHPRNPWVQFVPAR